MRKQGISLSLVVGLLVSLLPVAPATGATGWTTSVLATPANAVFDLKIDGNRVVWEQWEPGGSDGDVWTRVMGGAAPSNVSDRPGVRDEDPSVSGNRIAWVGETGSTATVFTWKLGDSSPTQVAVGDYDEGVRVNGDRLFWSAPSGTADNDTEVYTWAVGDLAPTNVSNNPGPMQRDGDICVSGDRVVWVGVDPVGGDTDIYTWAVSDPVKRRLTENTTDDLNPDLSGSRVVWEAYDGNDWEVYTTLVGYHPVVLSNRDGLDDYAARVSGDRIVWEGVNAGWTGSDIFTFVIGDPAPTNISNTPNTFDDTAVVAGDCVAWQTEGEAVFAWTPSGLVDLSDSDPNTHDYGPVISADGIAWIHRVGDWDTGAYSILIAEPTTVGPTVVNVQGDGRIQTAIEASQLAFADGAAGTVLIATAYNWPDALGGAALAGAVGGPILLTGPTLHQDVQEEIDRLGATEAIILGGETAVTQAVEDALKQTLGDANVERLSGRGRYETSYAIAARTIDLLGPAFDGTAFLATGVNFPDALGASPLAAANGWPIYLVNPVAGADGTLINALKADGVTEALLLGGDRVVSAKVKTDVASKVPCATDRLFGVSRYDTARDVAEYGITDGGLSWNRLAIATGQNFPDALAGGVLQGQSGSVLLLTPSASLDPGVRTTLVTNKAVIGEVRFLGGDSAISPSVRSAVLDALD